MVTFHVNGKLVKKDTMTIKRVESFEIHCAKYPDTDYMQIREFAEDKQVRFCIVVDSNDEEIEAAILLHGNELQELIDILQPIADKYKTDREVSDPGPYGPYR